MPLPCPICRKTLRNDEERREVKTAIYLDFHGSSLVGESSSGPLSRWRHGFESRWGCSASGTPFWTDFALGISSPIPEITEALTGLQQDWKVKDVLWPSGCFLGPDDIVEICNGNELTVRLEQVRVTR